ncbi:MAG TPA: lanthionine synthetase LanC family protein [Phytomonospora sp.]
MTLTRPAQAEALGAGALDWLLETARDDGSGLAWPTKPSEPEADTTLYSGTPGVVLALLDGHRHFGLDKYADAAVRAARTLADGLDAEEFSLYSGITGSAVALRAVARLLDDKDAATAAERVPGLLRDAFDGTRWGEYFDLLLGNAGIALAALDAGDLDLAVLAVEPYLATAEETPFGVCWELRPGAESRFHHYSHGTLGIAAGLAAVGRAADRADLLELALAGVADVVARNEAGADGFLVPHSDPQLRPDLVTRHNYGWCHGPAGDAHAFRFLAEATGDPAWSVYGDRCWRTLLHSGLPERLYPGFWDNNGRCCGTAGVLSFALDRMVESGEGRDFAEVLVADLCSRAIDDGVGVRWSNVEHRETPSELEPHTGWAMGNAGIARELLRYARLATGRDQAYAAPMPDQPVARPRI